MQLAVAAIRPPRVEDGPDTCYNRFLHAISTALKRQGSSMREFELPEPLVGGDALPELQQHMRDFCHGVGAARLRRMLLREAAKDSEGTGAAGVLLGHDAPAACQERGCRLRRDVGAPILLQQPDPAEVRPNCYPPLPCTPRDKASLSSRWLTFAAFAPKPVA